jgi:hypothetical protein
MKKAIVAFALALAACAGASQSVQSQKDPISGHWVGVIDREGFQRPVSVMIDAQAGSYKGSWMSLESQPGVMLEDVSRSSDQVHLVLASLVFDGRVAGRSISGNVTKKSGDSVGTFTLTRLDPVVFDVAASK